MSRTFPLSCLLVALTAACFTVACGDAGGGGGGGGSQSQVAIDGVLLSQARFSPDGTRLVVNHDSGEDGEGEQVATISTDGTDLQIIADDANYLTSPTWTADGEALIVNGDEMYRIGADGTDRQILFTAFAAMSPDLSPDGTRVVYGINGGEMEIKTLDSEDPPTSLGVVGNTPRFSPDGTQIAFATAEAIRVMDTSGEEVRDVVTGELSYLSSVDWLPDGERLAITSDRGVEIVEIEQGSRRTIADGFATKDVDVSADGTRIVYGVNGQQNLTIIDGI